MIYNPAQEYDENFKNLHLEKTNEFFSELAKTAQVNVEENRKTVKKYNELKLNLNKLTKKLKWLKFLRVICCITIILLPIVFLVLNKKIKALTEEIDTMDDTLESLMSQAYNQVKSLNALFTDSDSLKLVEATLPNLSFSPCFKAEQEANMIENFDFYNDTDVERSTTDVLYGTYNENPFLFEKKISHWIGTKIYHGYRTISWREPYVDSKGRLSSRTRSQVLHATVEKPKPYYKTQVTLNYCTQGGPDLTFTRDATNLDDKSEKSLERYVKSGERKLKKIADKAIKENKSFVSLTNTEFEVLFDALDRNNEVQYRTLFTPLAQTNMVDLIRSQTGHGDDFNFIKRKRTNKIITEHSQGRNLYLEPTEYYSYSYDEIKSNFINKNVKFFKDVYFDFAPLWAIPIYQEEPSNSLKPIPNYLHRYSFKQWESLANQIEERYVVHPNTKTQTILKAYHVNSKNDTDEIKVTAHSYDVVSQTDFVSVFGGDGSWHSVPVEWDEYIPLTASNKFYVSKEAEDGKNVLAKRNNLCIYN